tara:strand:+ start:647 stop:979 length:333 start_codon:yes stop_codon:yes gene_type:complete
MYEERIQSEGVIYINDYKQVGSKQPEWTGTVTLNKQILQDLVTRMRAQNADSVEMRIALWDRVSKKNKAFKFARLDVVEEKKQEPQPTQESPPITEEPHSVDILDDNIPF